MRLQAGAATLVSAFQSLIVQIIAVVTLTPMDYGMFGLLYLAFAWTGSLSLSIISEPWSRVHPTERAPWPAYASAMILLVGIAGVTLAAILFALQPSWPVWLLAGASLLASLRAGARYYAAAEHDFRHVILPDAVSGAATVVAWAVATIWLSPLEAVAVAWLAGAVASVALSRTFSLTDFRARGWITRHKRHIRVLLAESVLLDAGSIGVPLVMTAPLGVAGYGIYRAAQSTTAPALLLLNPLRPMVSRWTLQQLLNARTLGIVVAGGLAVASSVALVLLAIYHLDLLEGSVVRSLTEYLPQVTLLVAAALPSHFYYLVARIYLASAALLRTRVVSLALAVLGPLGGLVLGQLPGALWGFALSVAASAAVLYGELILQHRRAEAERADEAST